MFGAGVKVGNRWAVKIVLKQCGESHMSPREMGLDLVC